MKRAGFSEEQIIAVLMEAEAGTKARCCPTARNDGQIRGTVQRIGASGGLLVDLTEEAFALNLLRLFAALSGPPILDWLLDDRLHREHES